jgi:hypothetical protein
MAVRRADAKGRPLANADTIAGVMPAIGRCACGPLPSYGANHNDIRGKSKEHAMPIQLARAVLVHCFFKRFQGAAWIANSLSAMCSCANCVKGGQ